MFFFSYNLFLYLQCNGFDDYSMQSNVHVYVQEDLVKEEKYRNVP